MGWYKCKKCGHIFIVPEISLKGKKLPKCPKCKSEDIQNDDYYNT